MSINKQLSDLYLQHQNPNEQFVGGGVVDETDYLSANTKVMMLLKEVNYRESNLNWSLVDLIQRQINEQSFYPIFARVGEWNCGLQVGFPSYQAVASNVSLGLLSIATTNLKKSGGGGESLYDEIREHAIKYKELWTREIQIIKPDVVICGGTFEIVREVLGFQSTLSPSGEHTGKALNTLFVQFYHPMYRVSPKMLYSHFKETMTNLGFGN